MNRISPRANEIAGSLRVVAGFSGRLVSAARFPWKFKPELLNELRKRVLRYIAFKRYERESKKVKREKEI